jgi:hypothetical protein
VQRTAQLEAANGVGARLGEAQDQSVRETGHSLHLTYQALPGVVESEIMIDVVTRHLELNGLARLQSRVRVDQPAVLETRYGDDRGRSPLGRVQRGQAS